MMGLRRPRGAFIALTTSLISVGLLVAHGPARGDSFEYAEDELPYSLNPIHESAMAETRLNELLFEGMWGPGYDGSPEPRLADAYELSPDRKTMTVYMREGLRWSDGQPITAEDVAFTIRAYLNLKTKSPDRGRVSFIKKAEAVNDTTLRLEFVDPEPEPLEKLYFKILPRHSFDGPAIEKTHPFWFKPTTSGPFKLSSQDLGTWTLEANIESSRPPQIGRVKVREMPDKNQQVSSLGYGYIQAMVNVPGQYLPEVERSRTADLIPYQNKAWWYVGMNEKNPHLKELAVRNALARALDLDEALALIGEGYRISGPFVPSSKFYNHSATVDVLQKDLAEASALMEAAGYRESDGVWTRRNKPIKMRLFYRAGLGDQGQTIALNLQSQLRRFGIDASDPVAMDKAVWNEKVFLLRDYDLVVDSWSFDKNENIYDLFHSKGTQNFVHYQNKEVDTLLEKGFTETDPAAKVAYMHETHRLLAQDLPYIFLWSLRSYTAVRRDVEGVFIQPFYYFSQFSDWRLPAHD